MLILSGYGTKMSPRKCPVGQELVFPGTRSEKCVATKKRTSTPKPPAEEKPGFFSTLFTKTAEGVASSITGQPSQAQAYTPSYYPDSESGKIFGINQYIVYAGAGIGILGLLLLLKKIRSKRQSGMIVNPPIQTIQIPSKL